MTNEEILAACDHTLLKQTATWKEIQDLCDEGVYYHTASVCIPPCYVREAKNYVGNDIKICTVIGFPNGNMTTNTKVYETKDAVQNGADEIDMVINIGRLKDGKEGDLIWEIDAIKKACEGRILKVIVETCLLTKLEKIAMCRILKQTGADFIKTSTGFSTGGATFEDVKLFKEHVGDALKIKAAGGITTLLDAEEFIRLGASRLGTSRVVKLVKEQEGK